MSDFLSVSESGFNTDLNRYLDRGDNTWECSCGQTHLKGEKCEDCELEAEQEREELERQGAL
jgi:hypothetical protein